MDKDLYKTANSDLYMILKANAKENRKVPTEAERYLWEHIRRGALGVKFNRQQPVLDFIADFICFEKKLIIEVDGEYHKEQPQQEKDKERTDRLQNMGYKVIRFTNEEVLNNIDCVLSIIEEKVNNA